MKAVSWILRILAIFAGISALAIGLLTMGKIDKLDTQYKQEIAAHEKTQNDHLKTLDQLDREQLLRSEADSLAAKAKANVSQTNQKLASARKALLKLEQKTESQNQKLLVTQQRVAELEEAIQKAPRDDNAQKDRLISQQADRIEDLEHKLQRAMIKEAEHDAIVKKAVDDILKAIYGDGEEMRIASSIIDVNMSEGTLTLGSGKNQKLNPNQVYLLAKDGRNIARIKIQNIGNSQSIANILPGYGVPFEITASNNIELVY